MLILATLRYLVTQYLTGEPSTLRSLLNEQARLTELNTVKQASSFNRDLRVL